MSNHLKKIDYHYHSFDAQFQYHLVGLSGFSATDNWNKILSNCKKEPWVLDNWTTEDHLGKTLKKLDPTIYLLYDTHKNILDRYRVPIVSRDAYYFMYEKMYKQMEFEKYNVEVRYFQMNHGETTSKEFRDFIRDHGNPDDSRTFDQDSWRWI